MSYQAEFTAQLFATPDALRVADLMWRVYVGDAKPSAMYCKPENVRENYLEMAGAFTGEERARVEGLLRELLCDETTLSRSLECEAGCEAVYAAHGWEFFGPYECFFREGEMP